MVTESPKMQTDGQERSEEAENEMQGQIKSSRIGAG